ncbi:hypothetical protein FIBSPDRAFT_887963 [Athelia psychrophila]|uniref:Uncharacterized protein n=1 Tax=Athelia psychrophila TaxID=1759441 RepID=A0A166P5F4_9AGAM|nr:hypothetical protein FIBSPDRAFT_887963 [Fibularhizoctonia sp. CBS 109695]
MVFRNHFDFGPHKPASKDPRRILDGVNHFDFSFQKPASKDPRWYSRRILVGVYHFDFGFQQPVSKDPRRCQPVSKDPSRYHFDFGFQQPASKDPRRFQKLASKDPRWRVGAGLYGPLWNGFSGAALVSVHKASLQGSWGVSSNQFHFGFQKWASRDFGWCTSTNCAQQEQILVDIQAQQCVVDDATEALKEIQSRGAKRQGGGKKCAIAAVDNATQKLEQMTMLLELTQEGEATSNLLAVQPSGLPSGQAASPQVVLDLPLPDAVSPLVTSPAPIDNVSSPDPEDANLGGKRGHTTDSGANDSDISEAVPVKRTRKKKNLIEDLSSDEEAQEKAESKRIEAMLKDGKEAQVTAQGNEIIDDFIRNPATHIPIWIRRRVKDEANFLPRAVTTSRELATIMLKTSYGNFVCLYHDKGDKSGTKHDGIETCTKDTHHRRTGSDPTFKVTGVPYCRPALQGVKPERRERWLTDHQGHIHCGCELNIALFELYAWKTWKATNKRGDSELLGRQRMDPRTRQFVAENFFSHSGLTIDTLYDKRLTGNAATMARLLQQIQQLAANFDELAHREGLEGHIEFTLPCEKNDMSYF